VELTYHVEPENLSSFDAILVGVPTYHHDMTVDIECARNPFNLRLQNSHAVLLEYSALNWILG